MLLVAICFYVVSAALTFALRVFVFHQARLSLRESGADEKLFKLPTPRQHALAAVARPWMWVFYGLGLIGGFLRGVLGL